MKRQVSIFLILIIFCEFALPGDYIFSAPPTETSEESLRLYQPVAAYLSRVTGEEVVFQYPGNWHSYLKNMRQAKYDFLLDAPHFVSWRVEKIEHMPLISLGDSLVYVVVVLNNESLDSLYDLRGKTACSSALPNLDALTLADQYESVWTQPAILVLQGHKERFDGLLSGKCHAVILPKRVYEVMRKGEYTDRTKILFESQELPHFGFSASPRINSKLRQKIQSALVSSDGDAAFRGLARYYGLEGVNRTPRTTVDADTYRGYAYLLAEFWGF